jgi:S1-C subfamily serine protease
MPSGTVAVGTAMTGKSLLRAVRFLLGLSVALVGGPACAQDAAPVQSTIKLVGVIAALPAGAPWLTMDFGALCISNSQSRTLTWTGGRVPQDLSPYVVAFKTELEQLGYKVVSSQDNLFDGEGGSADYQAAAVITDEHVAGCMSKGGLFNGVRAGDIKGSSSMKIDWQIYSPIKKQIVARPSTSASATLENSVPGGETKLVMASFAANARQLASNSEFRAAVSGAKPRASDVLPAGKQDKIALAGSAKAAKRPVADTAGSVVTILTGSGSGSGDLVSSDGYMLTNAHVVGDEKQVRVRWSDGIETVADVIRVAKTRDIALIKTTSRDREPIAIKRGPVSPGQKVYAIGSPLGKVYESTVSAGIVSAMRTMEGMRYIQSDVAITHGSSGGALLDENGALIGITVSTVETGGPVGINFFIPIGDAMDFLNLEQQ